MIQNHHWRRTQSFQHSWQKVHAADWTLVDENGEHIARIFDLGEAEHRQTIRPPRFKMESDMPRQIIKTSIVLALTVSPALAEVKLPLRNGAYIQDSCSQFEKYRKTQDFHDIPDHRTTMWIFAEPKEPLTISPGAEEPPSGYCAIKKITVSGDVYSGSGKCTEGKVENFTGVYKFSYTIISPDKFESRGKTYLWCADYRWGLK